VNEAVQPIVVALVRALEPLEAALSSRAHCKQLLKDLGWDLPITGALFEAADVAKGLEKHFKEILDPLKKLFAALRKIDLSKGDSDSFMEHMADEIKDLIPLFQALFDAVSALVKDVEPLVKEVQQLIKQGNALPAPLADTSFWLDLLANLPEYLLITYLKRYNGGLYAALKLVGIIDVAGALTDDEKKRIPPALALYRAPTPGECLYLVRVRDLVSDPIGYLKARYSWGPGIPLDYPKLLQDVETLFRRLGFHVRRAPIRPALIGNGELYSADTPLASGVSQLELPIFEGISADGMRKAIFGLMLVPAPDSPTGRITGLYLTNLSYGEVTAKQKLGGGWTLTFTGGIDATGAIGLRIHPGKVFFDRSPVNAEAALTLSGAPDEPWTLFGGKSGPALRLAGLELGVRFAGSAKDAELELMLRTLGDGMTLSVTPSDGDNFTQELLSSLDLEAAFTADVRWSTKKGLTFSGGAGFELEVPVQKALGPIFLDSIQLGLSLGTEGVGVSAGVTASASLGPFVLMVDGSASAPSCCSTPTVRKPSPASATSPSGSRSSPRPASASRSMPAWRPAAASSPWMPTRASTPAWSRSSSPRST
jgi:hypothetical protein